MKRSVSIDGHATSITLEDEFWKSLKEIAKKENMSVTALITQIDSERDLDQNLSSALRVYVLKYLKDQL